MAPAFGQVGSAVTRVKMIDAEGRDLTLSGDALRDIRSSYGLRGIIYEVTFQVQPAIPLRYAHDLITFAATSPPIIEQIFGDAEAVLAFLESYRAGILVERRRRDPDAVIGHTDTLKRKIRDHLWEWGASEATTVLTTVGHVFDPLAHLKNLLPEGLGSLFDKMRDLSRAPHVSASDKLLQIFDLLTPEVLRALHGFTAYRSDSNIDFTRDRVTFFDFTFWAYPVSQWQRVVTDYVAFCGEHRARFRPALFTEVYFICADDRSRLAFAPREHAFTLDGAQRAQQPGLARPQRGLQRVRGAARGPPAAQPDEAAARDPARGRAGAPGVGGLQGRGRRLARRPPLPRRQLLRPPRVSGSSRRSAPRSPAGSCSG